MLHGPAAFLTVPRFGYASTGLPHHLRLAYYQRIATTDGSGCTDTWIKAWYIDPVVLDTLQDTSPVWSVTVRPDDMTSGRVTRTTFETMAWTVERWRMPDGGFTHVTAGQQGPIMDGHGSVGRPDC